MTVAIRTEQLRSECRACTVREEAEKLSSLIAQQKVRAEGSSIESEHGVAHAVHRNRRQGLRHAARYAETKAKARRNLDFSRIGVVDRDGEAGSGLATSSARRKPPELRQRAPISRRALSSGSRRLNRSYRWVQSKPPDIFGLQVVV